MIPVLGKGYFFCMRGPLSNSIFFLYSPYYEYSLINEKDEED